MSDSGAPAATSAEDTASVRGVALGWANVAVSMTIPAISAAASAPSPVPSGTPSRAASSVTISHVAAEPGSIQSAVPPSAFEAWWSMITRGSVVNRSGCRCATAPTRSAEPQSTRTSRSYVSAGSGSVRNRSTPAMNAYSGGTGSVEIAVARAPHASRIAHTPSAAPSVSASGFSWLTTSALRAVVSRARTGAGTASRARAVRSIASVIGASGRGVASWAAHPDRRAGHQAPDGWSDGVRASTRRRWHSRGRPRRPRTPRSRDRARGAAAGPASAATRRTGVIASGSLPSSSSWSRWRTRVPRSAVSSRCTWSAGMRLIRSVRPSSWRTNPIECWSARSVSFWSALPPITLTQILACRRSGAVSTSVIVTNPMRGSASSLVSSAPISWRRSSSTRSVRWLIVWSRGHAAGRSRGPPPRARQPAIRLRACVVKHSMMSPSTRSL